MKEDANFIIDACNNYERVCAERDELLAALDNLVGLFISVPNGIGESRTLREARATLAKLKGT